MRAFFDVAARCATAHGAKAIAVHKIACAGNFMIRIVGENLVARKSASSDNHSGVASAFSSARGASYTITDHPGTPASSFLSRYTHGRGGFTATTSSSR